MSEFINLAKTLESSLTAAVRSNEGAALNEEMPGLSQFDTYSLLNVLLGTQTLESIEEVIYDTSETSEILIIQDSTPEVVEIVAEETVEEIVEEETTPEAVEIVVEETVEEIVEEIVEEETIPEAVEIVIKRPTPIKTEEELWLESNEFGFNEIDVVDSNENYFELLEEPDLEPVADVAVEEPKKQERRISEDQVVLVVENLVVNPNQATTVVSQGGNTVMQQGAVLPQDGTNQAPPTIIYQAPQQPQQIIYSPAPVQAPQVIVQPQAGAAPTIEGQPTVTAATQQPPAQQIPQFYAQPAPAPIIYQQAPAAPQEISVNIINDTSGQPAPIVYQTINQGSPTLPAEEQVNRHFDHKDSDQIIEIRSDATSVSANTVSVSSSAPMFPNLTNFDPRKYFSPNEIAAPRMDEAEFQKTIQEATEQGPSGMVYTASPEVEQAQTYANTVVGGAGILVPDVAMAEPEDMQKVTQMFQELRRMRDK
jgi:hypothetical protein